MYKRVRKLPTIAALSLALCAATFSQAATFTVTSTANTIGNCTATSCTLRAALQAADANPGLDNIHFNLAGAGPFNFVFDIDITINSPVIIDGYTQSGSQYNTVTNGINSVLKIQFNFDQFAVRDLNFAAGAAGSQILGIDFYHSNLVNEAVGLRVLGNRFFYSDLEASARTEVGGTKTKERNYIFWSSGVDLNTGSDGSRVTNNFFDDGYGMSVGANQITIGGVQRNAGNEFVSQCNAAPRGVIAVVNGMSGITIRGNRIVGSNCGLRPIALKFFEDTPTLNDLDDVDSGANGLQNFPVIERVRRLSLFSPETVIYAHLDRPNTPEARIYDVDFYLNASCDDNGHGEADAFFKQYEFVSDGPTDEQFKVIVPRNLLPSGAVITSIVTERSTGNSSEVSKCFTVP